MPEQGNAGEAAEQSRVAALRATYVYALRNVARLVGDTPPSTEELEADFDALLAQHDAWVLRMGGR